MLFYIIRPKSNINATLEHNPHNSSFKVLKGSTVSSDIASSSTFKSANSIKRARANGTVIDNTLMLDMEFKSASSAATFVTGVSTNGKIAWRDEHGKTLKEYETEVN